MQFLSASLAISQDVGSHWWIIISITYIGTCNVINYIRTKSLIYYLKKYYLKKKINIFLQYISCLFIFFFEFFIYLFFCCCFYWNLLTVYNSKFIWNTSSVTRGKKINIVYIRYIIKTQSATSLLALTSELTLQLSR